MRLWLSAFIALFLPFTAASAQEFPGTAPVKFFFRESLKDNVVRDPFTEISDESFIIVTERSLTISGTAPLTGFDLSALDDVTPFSITIGDFDWQGTLSDDENYIPGESNSVEILIHALNEDSEEVDVGTISLNWRNSQVEFTVQIDNVNRMLTTIDFGVTADDYRDREETIDAEDLTAAFGFGPYFYNQRTVYTVGTASWSTDDRVTDFLSDVTVAGAIDYLPPGVAITTLSNDAGPITGTSTAFSMISITGTATDKREIKKQNSTLQFDSEVEKVEVQVGTALNPGDFVEVPLDGTTWTFPNVPLVAGENRIVARATDVHGNVTTTAARKIIFLTKGKIDVEAEATGFPVGATGVAGSVKGSFLSNSAKKITAEINGPVATNSVKNIDAGKYFTVTATPAAGAVFNGWTATLDGLPYFTAVDEKLVFETKPNLVLRANFVPNPFDPIFGNYHGLMTGDNAAERGTFKVAISKAGAFTGKIVAGALTLPIRGKVLGSGRWEGVAKKGTTQYVVEFNMNVSGAGDRDLIGTLTGGGLSSAFTADLNDWRKARGAVPGNLATEYAASYNVAILRPDAANSSVPVGHGYGRVTISPLGMVKFVGKLGDATTVSAGGTLVHRLSGPVVFPLYIPLDKKQGSITGYVTYSAEPASDLTATLDWSEPATTKVEPQVINGQVELTGARYTAPSTGGFAILENADPSGSGLLELILPSYSVPVTPPGQFFDLSGDAALNSITNMVTLAPSVATDALALKMKVTPKTGLFSGTFKDPQLGKTIPFSGALVQKANGGFGFGAGVFTRGNRAGSIEFGQP